MSPLRLLQEPEKRVSFVKPKRFGGAGGTWKPETKIEKGLRAIQPYMPTPSKLFEAGRRYPRALFGGLEALQKAEPVIPAIKKGFVPEVFAPKEKVRTPTQIAWDMADRTYRKKSTNVAWEAIKQLPFTTAGVTGEIFTDPAIFLTFQGINRVLTNPQVAKFMGKEVKAPKWVDKTIRGTIKGFHRPLETISAGVKENRINALTNETYKKLSPYRTQIEKATKYKFKDEADFKGFIKSEFIKKGIYEAPLQKIQARIKKVKGLKPKVEPTPEPTVVKPKVSLIKKPVEPLRLLKPEIKPITPVVSPKPIAKPAITDKAQVQEIKNSIAEGKSILKSGKSVTGRKMSIAELDAVRRSVENSKEKIGLKKLPPHLQKLADKQKGFIIEDVTPEGYGPKPPEVAIRPGAVITPPILPKPVATPQQIKQAHIIAKEKAFITPEGKTRPGYRALAKGMTGVPSMKKMTKTQAESFITSLKSVSEPRYIKGKLVPPSIPRTKALVEPEFFQQQFRKPTPAKLVTSQTRYAELLGVKKLVAPMEIGKQVLDLEYAKGAHQIDTAVGELKKAKITPKEMAVMLNTLEETPDISEQGKKVFNYFRDLTRDVRSRENEIRATLKLPPIEYRQAYFRHIADKMSQEIIEGKYPLPEGIKYWSEQTVGKKVYNPMEMQRKLNDDLLEKFSSDLPYVMKSMLWTGLKEVHLSIPKNILSKELGILSKDKVVYKNLSPQEQKLYDAQMVMPASTKKWLLDYVNIVLSGRQTALDESINLWITDTPIKGVLNSILKPFGEHIGQKPATDMLSKISKLPIYGAMGGVNPRQLIRNKFQTLQNIALYGVKNTIKGYTPTSSYPILNKLKTDSLFKRSYSGFEDLPVGMMGKIEKAGLAPYQWSAVSNVSQAMNSSYHWTADNIQNPKKKHLGWADPKRTYTEPKDFFYPSEEAKLLKEMEYGAHTTQYQYIGLGMPEVFRYKAIAPLTRLQSWWMNHWFVFHREAATRAFTGHTGYDPKLKVTLGNRINYLKYLIIGGLILTNLGYYRSYLLGTAPTGLPPTGQLMMGLYELFTNTGDSSWEKRKRAQAKYKIKEAAKIHIPGYLSIKDFRAFITGGKDWTEYLFYKKAKKAKLELPLLGEKEGKLSLMKTKKAKLPLLQ